MMKNTENEDDFTRELPGDIIDQILSSMPIKDAVKTSILSSEWRDKWRSIPTLSFCPDSDNPKELDQVLKLRYAPIRNFLISSPSSSVPTEDILKWISHILSHPIKELAIDAPCCDTWTFPSAVFSAWNNNLTSLRLSRCHLTPPKRFRGFRSLKSLRLRRVIISPEALQTLISGSPALETLGLVNMTVHVIDAPKLKYFRLVSWEFIDEPLVLNCPNLEEFYFNVGKIVEERVSYFRGYNLIKLVAEAPRLRVLTFTRVALKYLASGIVPRQLSAQLDGLRRLSADVSFQSKKYTEGLYLLLSISPNLQQLQIECGLGLMRDVSKNREWKAEHYPRLLKVVVKSFDGSQEGISFLKLVLSASPILEEMVIRLASHNQKTMVEQRASPKAVISVTSSQARSVI